MSKKEEAELDMSYEREKQDKKRTVRYIEPVSNHICGAVYVKESPGDKGIIFLI